MDRLRDTTFGDAFEAMGQSVRFRWAWGEDEVQRLVDAGWERVSDAELRYTFDTAEGDERGVDVFAAAYEKFEYDFGSAVRMVPGRRRSATWVQVDLLMVLTSRQIRLVRPVGGPRAEEIDGDGRDDAGSGEVCDCHCHCELTGLDYCNAHADCGDYDEVDCDADEDDEHDCDEEDCGYKKCGECHCCICWKNCGCDYYTTEDCGCGCYECACACYSSIIDVDDRSGDDEPVTVMNEWPAFVAGLAQVLPRLGKGERVGLTAHGHRFASFQVRDSHLDCAIAGNQSVPPEYHLSFEQSTWLIQRGWYQYRECDRTYSVPFAAGNDQYVDTVESVVTVLRDFLGIARPGDLDIETTGAPDGQPRCRLLIAR
ncbi:hypothetical protein ACFXHA_39545 [Nocardia sp. NPDC059240]|uniref:TY-Chap domain-containing protein n=1 Tax=Nocardia sp. NPDC059240 TaxID=3346786 RepID=UPI0036AEA8CE